MWDWYKQAMVAAVHIRSNLFSIKHNIIQREDERIVKEHKKKYKVGDFLGNDSVWPCIDRRLSSPEGGGNNLL